MREQRRKRGGGTLAGETAAGGRRSVASAGLGDIFGRILQSAPKELTDSLPPLAVELWASQLWSIWATSELVSMDGLIDYAAERATTGTLMALRALGAIAPEPYGSRARQEADHLASAGLVERRWAAVVGTGEPTVAWLACDPIDHGGVSVMVEFDGPGAPSTIGVYIDHHEGGMARNGFAVPAPIGDVIATLMKAERQPGPIEYREISLEDAAARWRDALAMTDMAFDSPTNEGFDTLRALVEARLTKLPAGRAALVPPNNDLGRARRTTGPAQRVGSDHGHVRLLK